MIKIKEKLDNIDIEKTTLKIDALCWCIIFACGFLGVIGHIIKWLINIF